MNQVKKYIILSISILTLASCAATAQTTIYPKEGGTFVAISTSTDQSVALKDTIEKIESYCKDKGESYVIVSQGNVYSGVNKDLKKVANIASSIVVATSTTFIPTGMISSDDDNKTSTVFKCVANP